MVNRHRNAPSWARFVAGVSVEADCRVERRWDGGFGPVIEAGPPRFSALEMSLSPLDDALVTPALFNPRGMRQSNGREPWWKVSAGASPACSGEMALRIAGRNRLGDRAGWRRGTAGGTSTHHDARARPYVSPVSRWTTTNSPPYSSCSTHFSPACLHAEKSPPLGS